MITLLPNLHPLALLDNEGDELVVDVTLAKDKWPSDVSFIRLRSIVDATSVDDRVTTAGMLELFFLSASSLSLL